MGTASEDKRTLVCFGMSVLAIVVALALAIGILLKRNEKTITPEQQIAEQNQLSTKETELRQSEKGSIVLLLDGGYLVVNRVDRRDGRIWFRGNCFSAVRMLKLKELAVKTDFVFNYKAGDANGNIVYAQAANTYNRCERAK